MSHTIQMLDDELQRRLSEHERAFQDQARYLQRLQAQVDRLQAQVERHECTLDRDLWPGEQKWAEWMREANRRLGGR